MSERALSPDTRESHTANGESKCRCGRELREHYFKAVNDQIISRGASTDGACRAYRPIAQQGREFMKRTGGQIGGYFTCQKCGEKYHSSRIHSCYREVGIPALLDRARKFWQGRDVEPTPITMVAFAESETAALTAERDRLKAAVGHYCG